MPAARLICTPRTRAAVHALLNAQRLQAVSASICAATLPDAVRSMWETVYRGLLFDAILDRSERERAAELFGIAAAAGESE